MPDPAEALPPDRRVVFTRAGVARGMQTTVPLWLGMIPFGLLVGVVAEAKGLSLLESVLMSAIVFAGAAQLLALEFWDWPVPVGLVVLATLVVNIRMAPMGAAMGFWLDRLRGWRLWGSLATMVDHSFALSVQEHRRGGRDAGFLLGVGLGIWASWMVATTAGFLAGSAVRLPPGHPLFFASVAAFVSILAGLWRGPRVDLLPWLAAAAAAVGAAWAGLPAPAPLLAGTFAGAALGAWIEGRGRALPPAGPAERAR